MAGVSLTAKPRPGKGHGGDAAESVVSGGERRLPVEYRGDEGIGHAGGLLRLIGRQAAPIEHRSFSQ